MNEKSSVFPPATERALQILEYFAKKSYPMSISDISGALSIPVSSVYRIIHCLAYYGYLRESPYASDKYSLGYKLNYLSKLAYNGYDLETIALPYMKQLSEALDLACQLSVLNQGAVLTLDQILPPKKLAVIAQLGEPIPITASAAGKILFSFLSEKKQKEQLDLAWKYVTPLTSHTIVDKKMFLKHLVQIKALGYGTDFEEFALEIGCIAFPIFPRGEAAPLAALTVTGPIDRFTDSASLYLILKKTQDISSKISSNIR